MKIPHSIFLFRRSERLKGTREVTTLQTVPMLILASLCVLFGVFYAVPLHRFILPALGMAADSAILIGTWNSQLATGLLLIGTGLSGGILAASVFRRRVREVPT